MESNAVMVVTHVVILFLAPPFFLGVIAKTKALLAGKQGPPLLQLYADLLKLFRKGVVISSSSSVLLKMAPLIMFSAVASGGLLFPFLGTSPIHFEGDIILFGYLFALGRFWMLLAALDVGSSFEGMGASREATFGALSELAFFLGLVVLAVTSHRTSLDTIFHWKLTHLGWQPVFLLLFVTFFLILLAENSRIPVDDPNTHLELTMIHEVMILDYSGVDLGFVLYSAALKLFLFMAFVVSLWWPPSTVISILSVAFFFLKMIVLAIVIGVVETMTARLRFMKVPQFLVAPFVVALFALLVALSARGR